MLRRFFIILVSLFAVPATAKECVVLLHGLGRTNLSMLLLKNTLQQSGYHVWSKRYPSTKKSIQELSLIVGEAINECNEKRATSIHFVTHSLGSILVRQYFQDHNTRNIGRVVMLGPPNHGSEIVDRYKNQWWFRKATGPAGQELGTQKMHTPNMLKSIPIEVGIIAGRKSSDPWFSTIFNGENDGKVSVESAKLVGMKDFLVVESGHTFMMHSKLVGHQVLSFLKEGKFDKELLRST